MTQLAHTLDHDEVFQQTAHVAAQHDDGYSLRCGAGLLRAERAASCLVAPALGDQVIVATSRTGESWILAVLRRSGDETAIEVDGDLRIRSRSGQVLVSAREDVSITAGGTVGVAASALTLDAAAATVAFERLRYLGRSLVAELDTVRSVATTVESVVDRFRQRVKRSFRRVEEIDSVKANHIAYAAESTLSLRGDHAVITAERLVKLDGKQIHVG